MTVGVSPSRPVDAEGPSRKPARGSSASSDGGDADGRRWRDRPRWQRWLVSLLLFAAATTLVATPWWGPKALSRLDYFHVRTITFDGVRFAKASELVSRLKVDTTQSVWQSLDSLVARVEAHPMVLRVAVERDLPGILRVHVTERIPVALVPSRDGLRPADATGRVLPIDPAKVPLDMPIAASADTTLLAVLDGVLRDAPALYARMTDARRVSSGELRFTLIGSAIGAAGPSMANTLIIRTSPDVTVARFGDILPVEADLARNHLRAVELDLRFRDQVIARQP